VSTVEAGEGQRLAEALVKQVTGGDTVVARFMYTGEFEFRPVFKLWLAANHKPAIRGTDGAIWRRIRLVPFDVVIPEAERDPTLTETLKAEAPGILRWAVAGCLAWQQQGLGAPAAVVAATQQYREEEDPLADFLSERCVLDPYAVVGSTPLYTAYTAWVKESGERYTLSRTAFGRKLTDHAIGSDQNGPNHTVRRVGVRLRDGPNNTGQFGTVQKAGPEPSKFSNGNGLDSSGPSTHPFISHTHIIERMGTGGSTVPVVPDLDEDAF
jgi:putative DNA primase/helicase